MNRRRAPSEARRKPARKKATASKPAPKKDARNRASRKNGPAKRASAKRAEPRTSAKRSTVKKAARGPRSSPRAQNRRRPAPKAPRERASRKSWKERLSAAREGLRGWVLRCRKGLRRVGQALIVAVALAALAWVGAEAVRYAHTADAFAIREITIEGNQHLSDIDVRRAAGLQIGSNVFEISATDARNRLKQHPWVAEASVARRLPGRFRITVVERKPVALVALDHLYLVSEQGAVFKRLGVDDPVDLPVITGIASERFYDDLDYRTEVLLGSLALLHDYEGSGLSDKEPVSEIHFDGAAGIELFIGTDGMNVRLGNDQHRQKLRRLRQVLERLELEKTRPSYVYLDNVRSPERVTVRVR